MRRSRGFTLIELMIVVSIIGVLAALAIYGVARYLLTAKAAEATRALGAMETGAKTSFVNETDTSGTGSGPFVHKFCASVACGGGEWTQYPPPPAGKKTPPGDPYVTKAYWKCLKFNMPEPQAFSYSYLDLCGTGPAAQALFWAKGDLDGDGEQSDYLLWLRGGADGEAYRTSYQITKPLE